MACNRPDSRQSCRYRNRCLHGAGRAPRCRPPGDAPNADRHRSRSWRKFSSAAGHAYPGGSLLGLKLIAIRNTKTYGFPPPFENREGWGSQLATMICGVAPSNLEPPPPKLDSSLPKTADNPEKRIVISKVTMMNDGQEFSGLPPILIG